MQQRIRSCLALILALGASIGQWAQAADPVRSPDALAANVTAAYANPGQFGAVGDGVADDTAALQRALDSGKPVYLSPGKTYAVTRHLIVPSNSGIVSDGTGEIFARAEGFTNTSPLARSRYQGNSEVISASGLNVAPFTPKVNIAFRAFKLRYEKTEGRYVDGIVARNVEGLVISKVDIADFPAGVAIKVASIRGNSIIRSNVIRNSSSNTNFQQQFPGSLAQITAIEVDNDRINNIGTKDLVIEKNHIANITVGPVFLAAQGYQTDGINVASWTSEGLTIQENEIKNTGEAIDFFGIRSTIRKNAISDSYQFGIKLIHGASYNIVTDNTILRTGLAGIVLSGSTAAPQPVEHNSVTNNVVSEIDPEGNWARHETSCVQLSDNNATVQKATRNIIARNRLNPGRFGKWVINRANNTGGDNDVEGNEVASRGIHGLISPGDVRRARP